MFFTVSECFYDDVFDDWFINVCLMILRLMICDRLFNSVFDNIFLGDDCFMILFLIVWSTFLIMFVWWWWWWWCVFWWFFMRGARWFRYDHFVLMIALWCFWRLRLINVFDVFRLFYLRMFFAVCVWLSVWCCLTVFTYVFDTVCVMNDMCVMTYFIVLTLLLILFVWLFYDDVFDLIGLSCWLCLPMFLILFVWWCCVFVFLLILYNNNWFSINNNWTNKKTIPGRKRKISTFSQLNFWAELIYCPCKKQIP